MSVLHRRSDIDELMPFYRDMLGFRLTDYYSDALHRSISSTSTRAITASPSSDRQESASITSWWSCPASTMSARATISPARGRPRRGDARPPHQRLHDLVLHLTPSRVHGRIRLGRPRHRSDRPGSRTSARKARASGATTACWLAPEDSARGRATCGSRMRRDGLRRPVQVMDGNFDVMPASARGSMR